MIREILALGLSNDKKCIGLSSMFWSIMCEHSANIATEPHG